MMFPVGLAKSSQGGVRPHRSTSRSGVLSGAAVVDPGGSVVPVVVEVKRVTVFEFTAVAAEPFEPPQAVEANISMIITLNRRRRR
jgi:hypothetical protein